jgi:Tfp pilus assembly protein FimT
MLVVISIMGLIVAASVPAFARYGLQMRLKSTTRQAVGLITLARQQAMAAGEERTVLIDPEARELLIEESLDEDEPKRVPLPPSVAVSVSPGDAAGPWRVAFQPSGGVAGRTTAVTFASEGRSHTITVIGATGAVSLTAAQAPASASPDGDDD